MNQIVNALISALGLGSDSQTIDELKTVQSPTLMTEISVADLKLIGGGDGAGTAGPRGGW